MKIEVSVIPEYNRLDESAAMAEKYNAHFEYNDFFLPAVYMNQEEIDRRVDKYLSLGRNTSKDTLHGVFLDMVIHSTDPKIAEYSKQRIHQSMEIAKRLGVKGVIFHTGLIAGFKEEKYVSNWIRVNAEFFSALCEEYPDICVYMENMFDYDYELILKLSKELEGVTNFGMCLDYAHAAISHVAPVEWLRMCAPYIKHMHINDNDLKADLHQPVGTGQIDWSRFQDLMMKNHIHSTVLVEVKGYEAHKKSLEYLQQHQIFPFCK